MPRPEDRRRAPRLIRSDGGPPFVQNRLEVPALWSLARMLRKRSNLPETRDLLAAPYQASHKASIPRPERRQVMIDELGR
jgi:hypothetical protein